MTRLLAVLPLVVAVGCGYGFDPGRTPTPGQRTAEPLLHARNTQRRADASPDQEAIQAALDFLKGKSKELFDALKADAQPSAVKKLAGDMAAALKEHDLAVAPAEFKLAWARHRKAWTGLQSTVSRLADAYEDTEFIDALLGLFKNDPNRGRSLGGDMDLAVKAVTKSHAELYASAEGYGIEVEK